MVARVCLMAWVQDAYFRREFHQVDTKSFGNDRHAQSKIVVDKTIDPCYYPTKHKNYVHLHRVLWNELQLYNLYDLNGLQQFALDGRVDNPCVYHGHYFLVRCQYPTKVQGHR